MLGQIVGSYRITGQLGEGGMGVVFAAEHTLIGRRVAVKMLQYGLSQRRDMVERFFNEARASALVKHAGIVDVYDFGYHSSGAAFIVMELLEGESLAERLRRTGRLSIDASVRIARQTASALAAAHRAGIVHRDLKPDNVFLVRDPEIIGGDRVKLLDFGIAKLIAHDGGGSQTITGMVIGTPSYMSPEQCAGSKHIDARSDLYSLGCLLFAMVSGRVPFAGETGWVVGAHQHLAPPDVRSIAPEIAAPLAAVIARLLAKSRDDRFPDAGTLAAELSASDASAAATMTPAGGFVPFEAAPGSVQTTLSAADGAIATPPPRPRDRRGLVVAITATAVVLVVALVVALSQGDGTSTPTGSPPRVAIAPLDAAAPPPPPPPIAAVLVDAGTAPPDATPAPEPAAEPAPEPTSEAPSRARRPAAVDPKPTAPVGTPAPTAPPAAAPKPAADPVALIEAGLAASRGGQWSVALDRCNAALRAAPAASVAVEAHDLCARAACKLKTASLAAPHIRRLGGQRKRSVLDWCKTHGLDFATD